MKVDSESSWCALDYVSNDALQFGILLKFPSVLTKPELEIQKTENGRFLCGLMKQNFAFLLRKLISLIYLKGFDKLRRTIVTSDISAKEIEESESKPFFPLNRKRALVNTWF